jgi:hypothetical protein
VSRSRLVGPGRVSRDRRVREWLVDGVGIALGDPALSNPIGCKQENELVGADADMIDADDLGHLS